jgi:hypothetical protein
VELNTGGYIAAKAGSEPPGSRPEDGAGHLTVWRRVAPAVGLILLAPLVGEYLLGNLSIRDIVALLFLAPMYGGGALLIREVARRTGSWLATRWSRREGWSAAQRLALAGGALLTYAWVGFVLSALLLGRTGAVDLIGNAVFAAGAVVLLAAATRKVRRTKGSL